MKEICLLIFCLFSIRAAAQENYKLAKTIDSLYEQDQSVQFKLKAMYDRNAPQDSLKQQDSLKKAIYLRGAQFSKNIYGKFGYPTKKNGR